MSTLKRKIASGFAIAVTVSYGSRDRRCSGQRRERQGQLRHEQHRGHLVDVENGTMAGPQRDLRPEDQQLLLQHAEQALAGHRRLRGTPQNWGSRSAPVGRAFRCCDHHLRRHGYIRTCRIG